jgi:hypothetical protein
MFFIKISSNLFLTFRLKTFHFPKLGDVRPRMTLGFLFNGKDYITKDELAVEFELNGF